MPVLTPRRAALGALAAGGLAAALVVFVPPPWGWGQTVVADSPQGMVKNPAYFPSRSAPPPLRIDRVLVEPALISGEDSGDDGFAPPCEGCLNEAGALDVAETFIYHMRHEKYIGTRAELYSAIAARLEAAGLPPPHETGLPKLPPGLVDAPPDRSMSGRVLPFVERPGETWVIWVQEGWFDTQSYIDGGILPPAAAAWPPLRHEKYMLVDARSGEVFADDIWRSRHRRSLGAYGDVAAQAAARRAEHWIGNGPAP